MRIPQYLKGFVRWLWCWLWGSHAYDYANGEWEPALVNRRGECFGGFTYRCRRCGDRIGIPKNYPFYVESKLKHD